jgi:hypothetical protein
MVAGLRRADAATRRGGALTVDDEMRAAFAALSAQIDTLGAATMGQMDRQFERVMRRLDSFEAKLREAGEAARDLLSAAGRRRPQP